MTIFSILTNKSWVAKPGSGLPLTSIFAEKSQNRMKMEFTEQITGMGVDSGGLESRRFFFNSRTRSGADIFEGLTSDRFALCWFVDKPISVAQWLARCVHGV